MSTLATLLPNWSPLALTVLGAVMMGSLVLTLLMFAGFARVGWQRQVDPPVSHEEAMRRELAQMVADIDAISGVSEFQRGVIDQPPILQRGRWTPVERIEPEDRLTRDFYRRPWND